MAAVVSRGTRWTQDAAQKALEDHKYIKVGAKGSNIVITGAEGHWKKFPRDIYVSAYRMVGTPEDVAAALAQLGADEATIQQALENAYSYSNTREGGAMQARYLAEKQAATESRKVAAATKKVSVTAEAPQATLARLRAIASQLPQATGAPRATAGGVAGASGKKGGRRVPLLERLQTAQASGKVLDVSNMTAEGGNIKLATRNTTGKSSKIGPEGVAVVSSNPANFEAAMRMLGPEYQHFVALYNQKYAARSKPVAVVAAVAAKPLSPPRMPAATVVAKPLSPPRVAVQPQLPLAPARATSPTRGALPVAVPRAGLMKLPQLPGFGAR